MRWEGKGRGGMGWVGIGKIGRNGIGEVGRGRKGKREGRGGGKASDPPSQTKLLNQCLKMKY